MLSHKIPHVITQNTTCYHTKYHVLSHKIPHVITQNVRQFLHLTMFGSSFHPVVCRRTHVLFMMFCSSLPPVVCRRAHVLFRIFGSSFPPVVCRRAHVLFRMIGSSFPPDVCRRLMSYLGCSVRLYLQMFVGGSCLI